MLLQLLLQIEDFLLEPFGQAREHQDVIKTHQDEHPLWQRRPTGGFEREGIATACNTCYDAPLLTSST